jgi:oligoendopeptidase F
VKLSTGESVRLDDAAYTQYRALPNRADRDTVFRAFWQRHVDYKGTFGAALNAQMQAHVFYRAVHKYKSCVEASLFGNNIPPNVYTQLIKDVHASLPTLHRYLRLRQRMMGVKQLRYEDLYAPIVKDVDLHYTPEQAQELVLGAVAPLGKAHVDTLRHGYATRWIDWMRTRARRRAPHWHAYGVHPYQLRTTGLYDEVSDARTRVRTLDAHVPRRPPSAVTHNYATLLSPRLASTLNENLLLHYMLDRTTDKQTRLFLLGRYLENLRTTLFRQTLFAEFELKIHEMAERGQPLSGDNLTKTYLDILRTYYGDAAGVCKVDALYGIEWSYIDHFYYNFYVYQYATSIVASTAIANGIRDEARLEQGTKHRDAYLNMLSSGSSKYPIDLLKGAGVDMTTSAPFQAAMREMNSVMDEMDKLTR